MESLAQREKVDYVFFILCLYFVIETFILSLYGWPETIAHTLLFILCMTMVCNMCLCPTPEFEDVKASDGTSSPLGTDALNNFLVMCNILQVTTNVSSHTLVSDDV